MLDTSAENVMFLPLPLCLLAGELEKLSTKLFGAVRCVTSNKRLDFGNDPDQVRTRNFERFLPLRDRGNCKNCVSDFITTDHNA